MLLMALPDFCYFFCWNVQSTFVLEKGELGNGVLLAIVIYVILENHPSRNLRGCLCGAGFSGKAPVIRHRKIRRLPGNHPFFASFPHERGTGSSL